MEIDNKIDELLSEIYRKGKCEIDNYPEKRDILNIMLSRGILGNSGGGILHIDNLGDLACKRGGWLKHLKKEAELESKKEAKGELEIENLKLQNENLEYKRTIREQNEIITKLEIKLKTIELIKAYWWVIIASIGIGIFIRKLWDMAVSYI